MIVDINRARGSSRWRVLWSERYLDLPEAKATVPPPFRNVITPDREVLDVACTHNIGKVLMLAPAAGTNFLCDRRS